MKERFKQLPEPLQQQVIRRFAVTIVFVLLFFITLFGFWDVCLFLPCLLFAGFFIVNALRLFYTFGKRYLRPGGNDCNTKARKKPDA